jgi:hypothetical protein
LLYSDYYVVASSDKPEGTVEIFRPFGEPQSTVVSADLKSWITKFERPTVFLFDERTIGDIFGDRQVGVVLFQSADAGEALSEAFSAAAEEVRVNQGKTLIFTEIEVVAI